MRFYTVGLYSVGGAIKEKCYADKPDTIEHLKAKIRDTLENVPKIDSIEWGCVMPLAAAI